jgi:hypothetical protein
MNKFKNTVREIVLPWPTLNCSCCSGCLSLTIKNLLSIICLIDLPIENMFLSLRIEHLNPFFQDVFFFLRLIFSHDVSLVPFIVYRPCSAMLLLSFTVFK